MARKAAIAEQPPKAQKRRPTGEDYTVINLSMLTRFHIFVDEVRTAEGPVSFRFFMKKRGSHRTMALTVDAIEKLSQQLLLRREILDEDGRPTGRYLTDYKGVTKVHNKRTNGISPRDITPHGDVWAELGMLVDELFDMVCDKNADPADVSRDLRKIRGRLLESRRIR